jgi:uncharacterized RDD family membrane protein YckC
MNVTEQDLRERYETLNTEQLIELQAHGGLTEMAARVLEQVLAERSVSVEERVAVASAVEKRAAARDAMTAALASLEARLGAQVIDFVVTTTILLLSMMIWMAAAPLGVLGFILALAYLLLADGLPGGQSVGKRALGIAVIDQRTKRACTYGESFVRNLPLTLLGIIDWAFIFGRTRQRLGDRLASTVVVRVERRGWAAVGW